MEDSDEAGQSVLERHAGDGWLSLQGPSDDQWGQVRVQLHHQGSDPAVDRRARSVHPRSDLQFLPSPGEEGRHAARPHHHGTALVRRAFGGTRP